MNVLVAVLQLLVAAAFLSIPLVRHLHGASATAAAKAELERQGVPTTVLAENGMRFDAGGHETAAPAAVAAVMVTLAGLNAFGHDWARPLTLVFQSLVLVGNCLIVYSHLTAEKSVRTAFKRKGDPNLARIDVKALLAAGEDAFPGWTRALQVARNTVVFGASIVVLAVMIVA